jgi:hypothetical protein
MAAVPINLVIEQGTDFYATFTVTNDDGTPLNLSGFTGTCKMKRSHASNSTPISVDLGYVSRSAGKISISMSAANTTTLKAKRYVYEIILISPNNVKSRVIEGLVEVTPGVL